MVFSGNLLTDPLRAITEKWSGGKIEPILVGHFAMPGRLVQLKNIKTAQKHTKNLNFLLFESKSILF
jgi:hypothetical protein